MPYAVAVDATNLYWTNSGSPTDAAWPDGTVMKMPLAGGEAVALASNQPGPFNLVVDATNVYWTNYDNGGPNGALMIVPIAGGTPTPLAAAHSYGIAVDATTIYWTDFISGVVEKLTPK